MYPIVITCKARKDKGIDGSNIIKAFKHCYEYYDANMEGTVNSHIGALQQGFESGEEWVLMMQDDIILADDFEGKVNARLKELYLLYPHIYVCQFFRVTSEVAPLDTRWLIFEGKKFMWDQVVAYRFSFLRKYLFWISQNNNQRKYIPNEGDRVIDAMEGHDTFMAKYLHSIKEKFAVTVPHLVQHDLSIKSTLGTNKRIFGRDRNSVFFNQEAQ